MTIKISESKKTSSSDINDEKTLFMSRKFDHTKDEQFEDTKIKKNNLVFLDYSISS